MADGESNAQMRSHIPIVCSVEERHYATSITRREPIKIGIVKVPSTAVNLAFDFEPCWKPVITEAVNVERNERRQNIVSFSDITCAAFLIRNHVARTPCTLCCFQECPKVEIFVKKEFMQVTGSFKERGGCYALMTLNEEEKKKGVGTASLGNHSQSLSYHASRLHVPCTVVMPEVAPLVKIEACKRFGANVIVRGQNMTEARTYAFQYCQENGIKYINGYDDPAIITGQGTIGLELMEDIPNLDAIVVPVGGGGLIAGIALAAKTLNKNIKIIGVEPEKCASFTEALKNGKPVPVPEEHTLADGLAVAKVGENAFKIASPLIDKMLVVKEEWIAVAILRLLEKEKNVVEGAGAAGLAAILSGQLNEEFAGKKVAVILCGGNIDSNILGRCIEKSLVVDGRMLKFSTVVSDRPGGVSELCKILANLGASVKHIEHERAWLTSEVFQVVITVTCETRDHEHVAEIKNALLKKYQSVIFADKLTLKL